MDYLSAAIAAARKGGEVLASYFERAIAHEVKDDQTFVTEADKESERVIIESLEGKFPDHGFLGEESGEIRPSSRFQWVIDPLDGTSNFVNSLPLFAVSIALLREGQVVAAVVHNPVINLMIHAERGKGVTCNGRPVRVSAQGVDAGMVTFGVGKGLPLKEKLAMLCREAPRRLKTFRYLGTAALELAYVARGGTEGFVGVGNAPWDYAAGTLLVEEAGGTVTDFNGKPWRFGENYFVASNGIVHENLLALVKG